MDEPFGALDPKTRLRMQELLVQLWSEQQSTVFIVTHQVEEALYLGDRVFRMGAQPGRLLEILQAPRPDIPPEEMRQKKWFIEMSRDLLVHPRSLYLEWCKESSLRMKKFSS
jgi:NitT/TauT family transport system ATP-binding protein